MDREIVKETLTALLKDVANQARQDALKGQSDIGSIFRKEGESLSSLDLKAIEDAIIDINKATATKEGTRRLVNGLLVAAKVAAKVVFPS